MVLQLDHPRHVAGSSQHPFDLSANNQQFFSYFSEIAIEDEDPIPVSSDLDWDPTILDHTLDDDEHWYDAICDMDEPPYDSPFDSEGNYHGRVIAQTSTLPCMTVDSIDMPLGITKNSSSVDTTDPLLIANIDAMLKLTMLYTLCTQLRLLLLPHHPIWLQIRTLTLKHCIPILAGYLLTWLRRLLPTLLNMLTCP